MNKYLVDEEGYIYTIEDITKLQTTVNACKQENQKYKEVIDKAIDKLYCWGEALDPEFQKIMLDILKENGE